MKIRRTLQKNILLAGFYGGMAEVVWVAVYCLLTGRSGAEVAQQVTATLLPDLAGGSAAVPAGIAIHFVLALLLAMAYVRLVWQPLARHLSGAAGTIVACAALAVVWATNFFLVLPAVNPAFVALLPYGATLVSKLLFGVAMAGALQDRLREGIAHDSLGLPHGAH